MAGYKVSDYAIDTPKWAELIETIEKQRKGKIALTLTNYNNTTIPKIAAGSYIEVIGALYGFNSDETIKGTASDGYINYIYLDMSDLCFDWTVTPPIWSGDKQGWYNAAETNRYIGGCYRSGGNYIDKWIYGEGRNIKSKILSLGLLGAVGFKIGNATRNAAGNQVITGLNFRPSVVIFIARVWPSSEPEFSWGFDNGSEHYCTYQMNNGSESGDSNSYAMWLQPTVSDNIKGYISAKSDDGFTITWTTIGTPPTANYKYLAFM